MVRGGGGLFLVVGVVASTVVWPAHAQPPPGRPAHPGEERHHRLGGPLEAGEEARALDFVRRLEPAGLARLEGLKRQEPMRYNGMIHRLLWLDRHLERVAEREDSAVYRHDADAYRRILLLSLDVEDQAIQYRQTTDDQARARLRAEVTKNVTEVVAILDGLKRDEMNRMAGELERVRRAIEQHERDRPRVVERRVRRLLDEPEDSD